MGEVEVYKTLFEQVEDEVGATPGAYCSRKAALRALELLRAEGKKQSDEDIVGLISQIRLRDQTTDTHKQTIERQAQAIKRLEEESTRNIRLGSEIPYAQPGEPQYSLRKELNNKLDQGKPWKNFQHGRLLRRFIREART